MSESIKGMTCAQIKEPWFHTRWMDNYFCHAAGPEIRDIRISWSYKGMLFFLRSYLHVNMGSRSHISEVKQNPLHTVPAADTTQ